MSPNAAGPGAHCNNITTALLRRVKAEADDVVDPGFRVGSGEELNVSCRKGLMPHRFQVLATVTFEIPNCLPRIRLDQCVTVTPSCSGGGCKVTSSTS